MCRAKRDATNRQTIDVLMSTVSGNASEESKRGKGYIESERECGEWDRRRVEFEVDVAVNKARA